MSDSPWNDFFEEDKPSTPVDRHSTIFSNPVVDTNEDLGAYNYDYAGESGNTTMNDYNFGNDLDFGDDMNGSSTMNGGNIFRDFSALDEDEPVDESKLNASIKRTQRKKSKNADLSQAFQNDISENEPSVPPRFKNDEEPYNSSPMDHVPIWKQLINFFCMSISIVMLPWMVYLLMLNFVITHLSFISNILPVDIFVGYIEILTAISLAIVFGLLWNALSVIACRMWIRRVVLPLLYILTLVGLNAVIVFLLVSWATQYTAKFIWGIAFLYMIVLVIVIPVWILRFIKQEYMIRFFARRILVYTWHHKIAIPIVLLGALLQGFICLLVFIFNAYWYATIPVALLAMDVIRNSLLYALCRMDRHFLEEGKSNATLSLSYVIEASVMKTFWILVGTTLSIFQPFIAALRSVSLAIIIICVTYNYLILFFVKVMQSDTTEENRSKKAVITVVLGVVIGPLAIFLLILSYLSIVISLVSYVVFEFLLIFMSRGVIASMGFFRENWFQAIFRQIRTRLHGAFFTSYPISEADTIYDKVKCLVHKLIASISEVNEANNVLLYFSEMGSILSACLSGIVAFWWIGKLAPTDEANMEIRKQFYPYYQGILVCLAIGYIISGTVLQLVEAHTHSLCLCMKYHNNSLLSKFTKIDEATLEAKQKKEIQV